MEQDQSETKAPAAVRSSDLLGQSSTWFSYDPGDGFETHDTETAARARAEKALDYYKDESGGDGWNEEVEQVCWGKIAQKVEMLWRKERPAKDQLDESNCNKEGLAWGEWDEMRDYGLCPNTKLTPLLPSVTLSARKPNKYEKLSALSEHRRNRGRLLWPLSSMHPASVERKEASGSCGCSAWFGGIIVAGENG